MIADIVQSGLSSWYAPALAFLAGVVSFVSPCVLPLVPGYLSFITADRAVAGGGPGGATAPTAVGVRRPVVPILLFVLGFASVFTLLGAFAGSALSRILHSLLVQRVAGVFVILFGVFMLLYAARARIPWLYREERPLLARLRPGRAGAFPLGAAFAVGWTPCIGPVLAGILTLAAAQGNAARAAMLLFVYSLGLGVPFLLIGLGVDRLMGAFRFFSRNYRPIAAVSGVAMVVIGTLLASGAWTRLVAPWFSRFNLNLPI